MVAGPAVTCGEAAREARGAESCSRGWRHPRVGCSGAGGGAADRVPVHLLPVGRTGSGGEGRRPPRGAWGPPLPAPAL